MSLPTASRYSATAIWLHWLLAVAIVSAFGVGLYVEGLPFSPQKLKLINWHKWAGVTILALSALRALQTETDTFEDNLSWAPSLIVAVLLVVAAGVGWSALGPGGKDGKESSR